MYTLALPAQVQVVSHLVECTSIRAIKRLTGIHRDTISRLLLRVGAGCNRLHHRLVRDVSTKTLQLDEAWSWVHTKNKRVRISDPDEYGDAWVYYALATDSRLIVSYGVDKRTGEAANVFLEDVRCRVVGSPQIVTDGWMPYREAVERAFGAQARHAMLVKTYKGDHDEEAKKDGSFVNAHKTVVAGAVDARDISTSYVERQNRELRSGVKRLARRTDAFSKRVTHLRAAIDLHVAYRNLCWVPKTLRVTPAMAAGLTDHVWGVDELMTVALGEPANDVPMPPAPRTRPALRLILGGAR